MSTATLLAKADGVLAGQALCNQILAAVDPEVTVSWSKIDGDVIALGSRVVGMVARVAVVAEPHSRLALGERVSDSGASSARAE